MSSPGYIEYHGLLLPDEVHSMESLEFAKNFSVQDSDVFAVTYPKSGTVYSLSYLLSLFLLAPLVCTCQHVQADNFVLIHHFGMLVLQFFFLVHSNFLSAWLLKPEPISNGAKQAKKTKKNPLGSNMILSKVSST